MAKCKLFLLHFCSFYFLVSHLFYSVTFIFCNVIFSFLEPCSIHLLAFYFVVYCCCLRVLPTYATNFPRKCRHLKRRDLFTAQKMKFSIKDFFSKLTKSAVLYFVKNDLSLRNFVLFA